MWGAGGTPAQSPSPLIAIIGYTRIEMFLFYLLRVIHVPIPFVQERVGNFLADFYLVNGLVLESRKRREHLSEEDILRNKAIMESLSKGGNLMEQNFEV